MFIMHTELLEPLNDTDVNVLVVLTYLYTENCHFGLLLPWTFMFYKHILLQAITVYR